MDGENNGNPIKMDDLGVPLFLETPIFGTSHKTKRGLIFCKVELPPSLLVFFGSLPNRCVFQISMIWISCSDMTLEWWNRVASGSPSILCHP